MRIFSRARLTVMAALAIGIIAVIGTVYYVRSAARPPIIERVVDHAWSTLGFQCSDGRFVNSGKAGRDLQRSVRVYQLRCDADNPTGFIALVGYYKRPDLARRDVQAYATGPAYGPACFASDFALVGFFTTTAIKRLCADLRGTYVPRA